MSDALPVSDETLFAYVDGELDANAAARVEAAMRVDPALAARVAGQRQLQAMLRARFDPIAQEPVPDRLAQMAAPPANMAAATVTAIGAARAHAPRTTARWAWREWGAMAATLVLGVLAGMGYHARDDQPLVTRDGNLVAASYLGTALSTQPAGMAPASATARIGLSIRAGAEYCRSFTVLPATAGLACQRDGQWVVDVVARTAPVEPGEFRQAESPLPEAVRVAIEQRMDGEPLTAAEEAAGIASGWRPAAPAAR